MEKLFSTAELSRMWNVSESTVKRWADSGDLKCVKTVGGHRRFRLEDISRFQSSHGFEAVGAPVPAEPIADDPLERALERRDFEALSGLFFRFAVDGLADPLSNLVGRAYLRGLSPAELHDLIVAPALRRVGELWRSGEITVADEHVASRTAIDVLARLQRDFVKGTRRGRLAVVGCVENELHEIGARCAASVLEVEGWGVVSLGANTPFFSFEDAVGRRRPGLVCVVATMMTDLERHARDFGRFRDTARAVGARVVLGGEGFRDPIVRARFPHDAFAGSFRELQRLAATI